MDKNKLSQYWSSLSTEKRREITAQYHQERNNYSGVLDFLQKILTPKIEEKESSDEKGKLAELEKWQEQRKKIKERKPIMSIKDMDATELENYAKASWGSSKEIREEFRGNFDAYHAYLKLESQGRCRIIGKKNK